MSTVSQMLALLFILPIGTPAESLGPGEAPTHFMNLVSGEPIELTITGPATQPEDRQGEIEGIVVDARTRRPLSGAALDIPASNVGAVAGGNGRYVIRNVPAGEVTIRVRLIGYREAEQTVVVTSGESTRVDFELTEAAVTLDELVVTGVGVTEQRRRMGTSMHTVRAGDLAQASLSSVADVLQSNVPGVTAARQGETGNAAPIRMRGVASLSQRNDPVVYVDGVRVDAGISGVGNLASSRLDDINPADIERVEVIQGAAAATLFGTEASSGVIQIFTKRGAAGATRYEASIDQHFFKIPVSEFADNVAFDAANNRLVRNNPARDIVRTGHHQNYSLSMAGGTTDFQYNLSGRFLQETGSLPSNERSNYSLRMTGDYRHSERLQSQIGLNVYRNRLRAPFPIYGLVGEFFLVNPLLESELTPYGEGFQTVHTALAWQNWQIADASSVTGKAVYQWRPNLTSQVVVGYNQVKEETTHLLERGEGRLNNFTGSRMARNVERSALTLDLNSSWQGSLAEDIGTTVWVGGQALFEDKEHLEVGALDFAAPGLSTLRGTSTITGVDEFSEEVINAGVYGQAQVGHRDIMFLTVGVRADGNSAFGDDFGFQTYPKVGFSYVVSDEAYWSWWGDGNMLRVRASYGTSGLQPGAFDAVRTYRPQARLANLSVVFPGNVGNPDLRPERSSEVEIGADFAFRNQRVGAEITYFTQRTTDAILPAPVSPSLGFLEPQLRNIGIVESSGIELAANLVAMQRRGFEWRLRGSISTLDQRVTSMGGIEPFVLPGQFRRGRQWLWEGYWPGAFLAEAIDPADPYSLAVPIDELSSLSQINLNRLQNSAGGDSLVFFGNPAPSFSARLSTEVQVSPSLRFRAALSGASGFHVFNETAVIRYDSRTMDEPARLEMELADPATSSERRAEIADFYSRRSGQLFSNWIHKGDYIRVEEIAMQYAFPQALSDRLRLSSLSMNVAVVNPWLITGWEGTGDPDSPRKRALVEGDQSILISADIFTAPTPRRLAVRMNASW